MPSLRDVRRAGLGTALGEVFDSSLTYSDFQHLEEEYGPEGARSIYKNYAEFERTHGRDLAHAAYRSAALTGWPSGWGLADPAAIPPPGMYQMQRAGVPVTPHTSLQVDAVFTSVARITNAITSMGNLRGYETYLTDDNVPFSVFIEDQPQILEQSFGDPTSGGLFQYDGMNRTITSMMLFGEAYWHIIERDDMGFATQMDVLHPAFMKVRVQPNGHRLFEYGTPDDHVTLNEADVIWIPHKSLPGATRGLSTVEYGGVIFAIALAAMEYGQRWFAQGASPSYLLSTDRKLGQGELTRIAERFLVEHGGLSNSHLPLVVDGGMKVTKIQSAPDEAQYLQTLEYARSAIFDYFGIPTFLRQNALERGAPDPPHVIGERDAVFLKYTLQGYITPLEEAFSYLLPAKQNAMFLTERFVQPDAQSMAAFIQAIRTGNVASANDVRTRYFGWAPSEEDNADLVMTPLASNQAAAAQPPAGGTTPGTKHDPEKDPNDEPVPAP